MELYYKKREMELYYKKREMELYYSVNTNVCDDDEDIVLVESDIDEEVHISEREDDSESELSAASNSQDKGNDNRSTNTYVVNLKKNRNITESKKWHKNSIQGK
ncbi:hypothetical protein NPIL_606751 [Nephila pilipes]|uniref:Uncharacterized protein n=1 Tax=Nephila pilipes TaxID=299642 RepID=A0A8X6TWP8_NEPPI|nr:hypothetical protein NPIL_606751 [Nephila pilipes]